MAVTCESTHQLVDAALLRHIKAGESASERLLSRFHGHVLLAVRRLHELRAAGVVAYSPKTGWRATP